MYISSSSYLEESAGDAGVAVIDTQGTISPEDDLLLGIYNQSSTPALSIPEIYSLEYDDDNDLLYVGGFGIYNTNPYEGGVSVIDTQGTKTLSDDILLGNYNKDTSVALRSETVQGIFIDKINDILYLSTSYDYNTSYPGGYRNTSGVYAIDRMGTKTLSDDVLLGVYNEFSSPSLNGVNTMRVGMDYDNNLLFLPAVSVGGFTVIDTQGTKTVSDDTLAYKLRSSTSPVSITSHGVQDFEYDNTTGYLYLSSFQANLDHLNSGFYIIDTNKTSTPTDDHIVNYYAAGTTPALTGSFATQFERFGNKIYLNEYSNLLVIDTKGTDNQGDDEVSTYEGYGFEAYYYSGIFLDSGNSLLYKTTPFGMAVLNLGSSLYNAQGIYYSPVFDSISDPYTILSWDETKQLGQNVSFYSRIIDESLYFIENFSSFNLSQVGDLNAWGQSVSSINLDNGNLVFSNCSFSNWCDTSINLSETFPEHSPVKVRVKVDSSNRTNKELYFYENDWWADDSLSFEELSDWKELHFDSEKGIETLGFEFYSSTSNLDPADTLYIDWIQVENLSSSWSSWDGPYINASGEVLDLNFSDKRYFQLKLVLETNDTSSSPQVHSFTLSE